MEVPLLRVSPGMNSRAMKVRLSTFVDMRKRMPTLSSVRAGGQPLYRRPGFQSGIHIASGQLRKAAPVRLPPALRMGGGRQFLCNRAKPDHQCKTKADQQILGSAMPAGRHEQFNKGNTGDRESCNKVRNDGIIPQSPLLDQAYVNVNRQPYY